MPCFKGLAVSIHTPDGPLSEYSVQKASRLSRISTYIPVPPMRIPLNSTDDKPEPSTFAISITLLTPGQDVPYSTPKYASDNSDPKPRVVGGLPGHDGERGKFTATVMPYVPLTTSPNETIAAYIYFDGRPKEEVATLLRKGEETWVNSRWVGVPESEGGGLAEREFLFREVGLERWLNGLDLEGQDAAAIIEKRRQKLERRRRKRQEKHTGSDDETNGTKERRRHTLRYGAEGDLQDLSDDYGSYSDTNSSDDDDPIPEAAGQIKVALFRVLASGEIKRGEYSPQFDAHDDDEESAGQNGSGGGKDVDHTTSFAKPKSLDPKTISTQTVTGIDPTDKPYATFTFFYRGERQLQKMGILAAPKSEKTPTTAKRRSGLADIPTLGPLKKEGTVGFLNYREVDARRSRKMKRENKDDDEMDSDSDEEVEDVVGKMEDVDDPEIKKDPGLLSPEDAERAGQVSEGIRKMKLKRQHSAEPLNSNGVSEARKSSKSGTPSNANSPLLKDEATTPISTGANMFNANLNPEIKKDDDLSIASPFKKQRSSMADFDDSVKDRVGGNSLTAASNSINEVVKSSQEGGETKSEGASALVFGGSLTSKPTNDEDEEL